MNQRHLNLFGAPRIVAKGGRIALPRKKALALLAYLAATGTFHTREALAALLWGDSGEQSANAYLRNALWTLNKALGADWAETEGGTIGINPNAIHTDVAEFNAVSAYIMRVNPAQRLSLTAQALDLYAGDFMAGFTLPDAPEFADWQMTTTESLRRTAVGVLMLRAEAARESGDAFAATDAAQRWVRLDPLDERANRLLIEVLADAGEATAAVRHYHELRRRLREELNTAPEPATVALFESLTQRAPVNDSASVSPARAPASAVRDAAAAPTHDDAAPNPGRRLYPPVTPLVGREQERADLARLLADPAVHLISLVAPGGMGKTQLARQAGTDADRAGLFPDGVYWIGLAPLCSADAVVSTIAASLPYPLDTDGDLEARLKNTLADKRVLLVIDNFEHVLDGAPVMRRLLDGAPHVKALTTSRERLNLRDERVIDLRGLTIPGPSDDPFRTHSDATDLFVRRAQQASAGFSLTAQNAADIARICQLVEGMPLAIELAASWTPLLSCAEIVHEIETSLDFLTSPARDVPERHRSLRAVFASSWEQMTPDEQRVLSRLAVFRGGFRLEAATAIAGASPRVLLSLVNKMLLKRRDDGRFEIHELLRQFAEGMLDPEARLDAVDQHTAYFASLMAAENAHMMSRDQRAALDLLQSEIDNIRSAWRHATARRQAGALSQMIEPLLMFCRVRSRFDDLPEMIDTAASQWPSETAADRALLAKLLIASALLHIRVRHQTVIDAMTERACNLLSSFDDGGEMGLWKVMAGALRRRPGRVQPVAEQWIRDGLTDLEAENHLWGIGYALYELGMLQHMQVRYAEARETLNHSLYYFEKVGQPWAITLVLDMLAENMQTLGNYVAARDYMARQIEPLRDLGMVSQVQRVEVAVAWLSQRGSLAPSMSALLDGLEDLQAAGDRRGAAWAQYNLAWVHLFERNFADAERLFHECLRTFITLGDDEGIVWSNIFLAEVALEDGRRAGIDPYVEGAQRALAEIDFPWGVSGLDYLLGNVALHDGDLPAATAYYRRAVEVAAGAQSVMQVLRHISGIADLWLLDERPEDALAMATYIHDHPTTWDDTRRRTRQLIEKVEQLLPPEEAAKAQAIGRAFTLELAIEKALSPSS